MTRINFAGRLTLIMSFLLSIFFIYTGAFKLISIDSFRINVSKTGVFSEHVIIYLPYVLATVEFGIAVLLILKPKYGSLLFSFTMLFFTFYITFLYNNNLYEICGCGGVLNGLEFKYHLSINIVVILLSLLMYYGYSIQNQYIRK